MDQRTQYLLQILESIGSPLMQAVIDASSNKDGNLIIEAQSIAALLGKTVEASISLGDIMEINPAEAQDDTLRVALAGLAGPLIAGQYKKRGRVPESPDIKKVTSALQAVLTFSDNFTPTPETVERLRNLEADGQIVDGYQSQIQYIQAFVPVVEAVAAFPFGQPEAKLVMDVSDKLVKKSVQLREALLPEQNDEGLQKRAELALLRSLASLYASCHREETQKATSQSTDTPASIDSVWKSFDMRAAMMESLAGSLAPEPAQGNSAGSGGGPNATSDAASEPAAVQAPTTPQAQPPAAPATPDTPAAPETQAPPPAQEPQQSPPPASPPAAAEPPPTPTEPPPAEKPAGANPMAMFAKPKTDSGEQAPATPPPADTPPADPPAAPAPPPEQPPTPPAAPPAESQPQEPPQATPPSEGQPPPTEEPPPASGNPMSFFKKKDDED